MLTVAPIKSKTKRQNKYDDNILYIYKLIK
jgi:hypothetical protein